MAFLRLRQAGYALSRPHAAPLSRVIRQLSSGAGSVEDKSPADTHSDSSPADIEQRNSTGSFEVWCNENKRVYAYRGGNAVLFVRQDVFGKSSFVRAGDIGGRIVRAKIVAMNKTHLRLDLGMLLKRCTI